MENQAQLWVSQPGTRLKYCYSTSVYLATDGTTWAFFSAAKIHQEGIDRDEKKSDNNQLESPSEAYQRGYLDGQNAAFKLKKMGGG